MKKTILAALMAAVMIIAFTGCSGGSPEASPSASATDAVSPTPAPSITATVNVVGAAPVTSVVTVLANDYMGIKPETDVNVSSATSNTGIAVCADGAADIGLSVRELKDAETSLFPDMKAQVICMDGIAIIVNTENKVSDLTAEQIMSIFIGETTDWSALGTDEGAIRVYTLGSSDEIRKAFDRAFLGYDADGNLMDTDDSICTAASDVEDMIASVIGNTNAIGYLPITALTGEIKAVKAGGVEASNDNVSKGIYQYYMSYYILTNNPSAEAEAFAQYCLGDEAAKYLKDMGYTLPAA